MIYHDFMRDTCIYSPQTISKKNKLKGGWGGRGIITTSPTLLLPALHPIFPPRLPTKIPKEIFLPPTKGLSLFVATQANSVSGFKAGGVVTKIQSVDIFKIEPIEAKDCEIIQCQIGKEIEENLPYLEEILWMEKMRESQIFQFISALSDASLSASFKIIIFHDNKCLMISGKC